MANKKNEILLRAYLGYVLLIGAGLAIVGKALYIQTVQGDQLRNLADSLTIFPKTIQAERGNIFASDGRLLATTLPTFDIRIDFKTTAAHPELFRAESDSLSLLLAAMFSDKTAAQYKAELNRERKKRSRYYLLKRNVTYNQMAIIRSWPLFRHGAYKSGMIAVQIDKRLLPFGMLAKRTIGFTSKDGHKVGLEGQFDNLLKGTAGQIMVQKIAGGVTLPVESRDELDAEPGKDIYTTIDIELQDVANDALLRALQHHQADHGCVVLMEVATGRIKAIANIGREKDSTYVEKQNYAVGEITEPGSTFKLATVAALMEDGIVNNETQINIGDGTAKFYNVTIRDHDKPSEPVLTLKRAIEVSSNVAVAKLAYQNYAANPSGFYAHLEQFGFTQPLKIELPGAAKPFLAGPKKWSGVSPAYIAHGYEVLITPLHTLTFYNAIANNGKMVQPYVVEKIMRYNTTVDSTVTKIINPQIASPATIKQLQEILVGVVQNGTAVNLKTEYLRVAGKTGTAVIAQGENGYSNQGAKVYQASFCGYFPSENPQYSMIVVINSPSTNGYYGNIVAGNIFKEVADKVYSLNLKMHKAINAETAHKEMPPSIKGSAADIKSIYSALGVRVSEAPGTWVSALANGQRLQLAENIVTPGFVPDVVGMSMKDALYLLEQCGLKVAVSGKGKVTSQTIAAGAKAVKGSLINIYLN